MFRFIPYFVILLFAACSTLTAKDLTPKHPKIVEAVAKAADYLEKNTAAETRLGGHVLVSMALLNAGRSTAHPFVQQTVAEIQKAVNSSGNVNFSDPIYTAGLSIIFLAGLEKDKYNSELNHILRFLLKNQRTDGSWTYLTSGSADAYPSGDMSMTQYVILALWTMNAEGFPVPGESVNRAARWLLAAQQNEGSYAYHTKISPDFTKIESSDGIRMSMSTAGVASIYVCRDLCGFNKQKSDAAQIHEAFTEKPPEISSSINNSGLPLALYPLSVRASYFDAVQARGSRYLEQHFYPVSSGIPYFYYYLYALERYGAFRELAENKLYVSPPWYDKTAELLLTQQNTDGCWRGDLTPPVDTSYAVLFLTRSTRKKVEKKNQNYFGGGNLIGGRGLPRLADNVQVKDGQIISLSEMTSSGQLLDDLMSDETDEDTLKKLAEMPADEAEDLLHRNKNKIKKLVGNENADKRLAAVALLGKSGDLSFVPALIYALSDPDPVVRQAAQDSLQRLARIPGKKQLPLGNEPVPQRLREDNIEKWKNWYKRIAPDAVFE